MLQLLYAQLARSRRRYYQRRPHIRRRLARPVISIGNLTVGGSGKTPLVSEIARMLIAMGEKPSILSRGYKRQQQTDGVVIVSDGQHVLTGVEPAGDEPFMMAQAIQGAAVVVHASRYLAGRVAESSLECTVHLLDDGFQHFELARDIDLLVTPPEDYVQTATLPTGRFREPLDVASAADALLVPLGGTAAPSEMGKRLSVETTFGFYRSIDAGGEPVPAFAFAGIAKPERFFSDLERAGWQLTGRRAFADHHVYSTHEVDEIGRAAAASGAQAILTTAKDSVRVPRQTTEGYDIRLVALTVTIEAGFRRWLKDRLAEVRSAA